MNSGQIVGGVVLMLFGAVLVVAGIAFARNPDGNEDNWRDPEGWALGCFAFVFGALFFYIGLVLFSFGRH